MSLPAVRITKNTAHVAGLSVPVWHHADGTLAVVIPGLGRITGMSPEKLKAAILGALKAAQDDYDRRALNLRLLAERIRELQAQQAPSADPELATTLSWLALLLLLLKPHNTPKPGAAKRRPG